MCVHACTNTDTPKRACKHATTCRRTYVHTCAKHANTHACMYTHPTHTHIKECMHLRQRAPEFWCAWLIRYHEFIITHEHPLLLTQDNSSAEPAEALCVEMWVTESCADAIQVPAWGRRLSTCNSGVGTLPGRLIFLRLLWSPTSSASRAIPHKVLH